MSNSALQNMVDQIHQPTHTPVAIEAIDLVKDYGTGESLVHALKDVNVQFEQGRFTAIMGPSGSGKSTLMHVMSGLDSATSGSVVFQGRDLTKLNDKQLTLLRRNYIGFIFQSFNLLPMFTAEQNIVMPLTLAGKKVDRAWFDRLVDTLGLRERLGHRPNELSGGQQQRVAIARALMMEPQVLLFDEPTAALDPEITAQIVSIIRELAETNITQVIVTHEVEVARKTASRVVYMENGHIVEQGDASCFTEPQTEAFKNYLSH